MLIVGRAVAGMGGSGLVIGTLTILGAAAPKHQQPGKFLHTRWTNLLIAIYALT